MENFGSIIQATLTPVALISGVGLLLLSMVNRYNHALDRVRELLRERDLRSEDERRRTTASIAIIYARCRMIRRAILFVAMSIVGSGAIVLVTALEALFGFRAYPLKALLLVASVGLVVMAAILFVIEITYSLHALELELEDETAALRILPFPRRAPKR
jgi:hypothetical protein